MKKLTAGIFATLMILVTVGAARADIASTEYVNGQLGTKENVANRVNNTSELATMSDTDKAAKYPSVKVLEDTVGTAVSDMGSSVDTKLNNYQAKALISSTGDYDSMGPEADKTNKYPSISVAEHIASNIVDTKVDNLDMSGYEVSAKKVADGTAANGLSDEQKKERYTSVQAAEDIASDAVTTKLKSLNIIGTDGTSNMDGYQTVSNMLDGYPQSGPEARLKYPTVNFSLEMAVDAVVDAMEQIGVTVDRAEGGGLSATYQSSFESTTNKANAAVTDETEKATKYPTVALTEKMIDDSVSTAVDNLIPANSILGKLAALDTSKCDTGECVLKYNAETQAFELESIVRGDALEYIDAPTPGV